MIKLLGFIFMLVLVAGSTARAQGGGGVRGGGDIIFKNGKWILKDLLARDYAVGETLYLDEQTKSGIRFLKNIAELYSGLEDSLYWDEIFGDKVDIRFSENPPCAGKKEPTYAQELQYGCTTQDGVTFLRPSRFNKIEPKQKLLAILHQRGHAFDPSDNAHDWIEPMVHGLELVVTLAEQQSQLLFRDLEPRDLKLIDFLANNQNYLLKMSIGAKNKRKPNSSRYITKHGGGMLLTSDNRLGRNPQWVESGSFVGVASTLEYDSMYCPRRWEQKIPYARKNTLIGPFSQLECVALKNSELKRVEYTRQFLGMSDDKDKQTKEDLDLTQITDSKLEEVKIHAYARIDLLNSTLKFSRIDSIAGYRDFIDTCTIDHSTLTNEYIFIYPSEISRWSAFYLKNATLKDQKLKIGRP